MAIMRMWVIPAGGLRRMAGAVAALMLLAAGACMPPSQQDMETAQALVELGESYHDLRQEQQMLFDQIDSLRLVVARQDSVIRTLANLAGVQVPR